MGETEREARLCNGSEKLQAGRWEVDLCYLFEMEAEDNCQEEVLGTARVGTSVMAHSWVHKLPEHAQLVFGPLPHQ